MRSEKVVLEILSVLGVFALTQPTSSQTLAPSERAVIAANATPGGDVISKAQQTINEDELAAAVEHMARVGRCASPSFSPDGKNLAFVCDLGGVPQVWTAPSEGGWPTLVTSN